MQNILKKLALPAILLTFGACEEPTTRTTEGISEMTQFPVVTLKGELWNTIIVGETFNDPGATAKEGDKDIPAVAKGTVDNKTPGVYVIKYVATNKDGFSASLPRYVGVISPSVKDIDISGAYQRTAGDRGISNVSRVKGNLYKTDNVGGTKSISPATTVYFYHYDRGKLGVPYQVTPGNAFEAINATIKEGGQYSWVVLNPSYGTVLRTFVKQ